MGWVKLSDDFYDNPKLARAGAAALLWVTGIAWSNRNLTDGFIPDVQVTRLGGTEEQAERLVALNLWEWEAERDGYRIHDYLEYQPTAERVRAKRAAENERWQRRSGSSSAPTPPRSGRGVDVDSAPPPLVPNPNPNPNPNPSNTNTPPESDRTTDLVLVGTAPPVPPVRAEPGAVRAVFQSWQEATGHHRAVLDGKRDRLIRQRLRQFPLADLEDAVRGWRQSPYHRGENPSGTVYDSLELLLRDAEHVEKFRDLERDGPALRPSSRPKGFAGIDEAALLMQTRGLM
jgi:hypothetical protein